MVIELIACLGTPFAATALAKHEAFGWLDPVIVCYSVGLILANVGLDLDADVLNGINEAVVPLAIPLLLFKTDFVGWARTSRDTVVGFAVSVFAALFSIIVATILFRGDIPFLYMVSGMLAGTWTGGSPNLMSVAAALNAPAQTVAMTNIADVFFGGVYLAALLTFAKPLLSRWLPAFDNPEPMRDETPSETPRNELIKDGAAAFGIALFIVAASAGISFAAFGELSAATVILGITTGGIAASFISRVRDLEMSYPIGNMLILMFCTAIGCLTDFSALLDGGATYLAFTGSALAMTLAIHYVACHMLRIDTDTAIITSVATVMGPPLVIPVARRLDNRQAFVAGMTSGLVGYAIANYVGITMARFALRFLS